MAQRSEHAKTGMHVSLISVIASIVLSAVKLTAGFIGHSNALISDGANSLGDVISYTIVMGGVAASDKKADSSHQYGHDKLESIVSILVAIAIGATGIAIGYRGIHNVLHPEYLPLPTLFPLIVAIVSIGCKLGLWRYTLSWARSTGLNSLRALATDHLSDVFSSMGALIGVVGSRFGIKILDPIASIIISLLIIRSAYVVFRSSASVLMDTAVDRQTIEQLRRAILSNSDVKNIDLLRTRNVGAGYYVELEISCCRFMQLQEAHAIAEEIHNRIEKDFPRVRHLMVHTNPCTGTEEYCKQCTRKFTITRFPQASSETTPR